LRRRRAPRPARLPERRCVSQSRSCSARFQENRDQESGARWRVPIRGDGHGGPTEEVYRRYAIVDGLAKPP
jgi:hypothetical protein